MAACALTNSHWQTSSNRPEGNAIILRSFASLAISKEEYRDILEACLPSEMARQYLLDNFAIHAYKICDIIWGAPISLYKKAVLLEFLASRENTANWLLDLLDKWSIYTVRPEQLLIHLKHHLEKSFQYHYEQVKLAIEALEHPHDGIFNLIEKWYDDELLEEKGSTGAPFLSAQKAIEYIRQDIVECEFDDETTAWYELEKWCPSGETDPELRYTFTFIGDEPVFFTRENPKESRRDLTQLRLPKLTGALCIPLPCKTGDLITVDCLPFALVKPALILEEDPWYFYDSCYPVMLSRNQRGLWIIGSFRISYFSNDKGGDTLPLSPSYQLRAYEKPLASNERILLKVKDWLNDDPERGKALWKAHHQAAKYEMTDSDIYELLLKAEQILAAKHKRGLDDSRDLLHKL